MKSKLKIKGTKGSKTEIWNCTQLNEMNQNYQEKYYIELMTFWEKHDLTKLIENQKSKWHKQN